MTSRATPPVIIAGMHRSGTSLVASSIEALGIDVGQDLLAADSANARGYFEDRDFLELHQRMMHAATAEGDGGHRDWGWTESERLDRAAFGRYAAEAAGLVDTRRSTGRSWGFKDPRTTLALDFWHELVPDARYVFVYRRPWDVADSMERLGADVFVARPDYAYRIWRFYNHALLDFCRLHSKQCLLLSVQALVDNPDIAAAAILRHLGSSNAATAGPPTQRLERSLLGGIPLTDPIVSLRKTIDPASFEMLASLDAAADLRGEPIDAQPWAAHARVADPRLSIVIPFHNDRQLVVEALASVERSVPFPCEVLIVNDGSTEPLSLRTLALLRGAGQAILDLPHGGLAAARNHGFKLARAPFVVPLDSDNRLLPGFIEPALAALEASAGAGVAYGDRNEFGYRRQLERIPEFDLFTIMQGNYIDACAIVRKSLWESCGGYDEGMLAPGWEDWSLWLTAGEAGWKFLHFPVPAFDYRLRSGSMSQHLLENPAALDALQASLVRKHEDLYRRFLPELLLHVQELNRLRTASAAAPQVEVSSGTTGVESELADLLQWAREHVAACSTGAAAAEREREALRRDNASLREELGRWQDRVRVAESSSAWKLRSALLRLRRAFSR